MADTGAGTYVEPSLAGSRIVVTGAGGQLGGFLTRRLTQVGAVVTGLGSRPGPDVQYVADIRDREAIRRALAVAGPDAVIHAAAYTDVDGCERDPERAMAVNAEGSAHVAAAATEHGARLIAMSTDFVFPGDGGAPYEEHDKPHPLSVYGTSKLAGEQAVLEAGPDFAVARTAWVWGGPDKHFPRTVLTVLRNRGEMEVVDDEVGCPTHAGDLADALVRLLPIGGSGVYHLAGDGAATRFELAQAVAEAAGIDSANVRPTSSEEFLAKYPLPARRPADSRLANCRAAAMGIQLPPWRRAVRDLVPALAAELTMSRPG
jgi:dTDP-4-dehydrorhamnose reductase